MENKRITRQTDGDTLRVGRWRKTAAVVLGAILIVLLTYSWLNRGEVARLAKDTRVVVRFPTTAINRLTPDKIEEQFPIQETAGKLEVTGESNAVGHVAIHVQQHHEQNRSDDAIILVEVTGKTDNDLVGRQSQVKIVGDGRGTFTAVKRIHFDGLTFEAEGAAVVEADHETEIVEIEPASDSPLKGAARLLASRKARAALPELNAIAAGRIREIVGQRVDELVAATLKELNQINRFEETVDRLHPNLKRWRIAVAAQKGFVEAALVPQGGQRPKLPAAAPSSVEVWMRLTRAQRTGMNLMTHWRQSHRLFRSFLPEDDAQRIADELTVAEVDDWTRLRIGMRALDRKVAHDPAM